MNGIFPKEWRSGKLILIEKPGKPNARKAYRPICLLNTMAKLLEQIINKRLIEEAENKDAFAPTQFGFRKGRSTMDGIQAVQRIAEEIGRQPNKYVVMVTLDVKNAFNSAPWGGIIEQLNKIEISPYIIKLICSYLESRCLLVGKNHKMDMTCGVPQGSVLGPTLWNLYYDDVLRLDVPDGTTIIGYADDLALVVSGENKDEIADNISWTIGRIENFMLKRGLQLAPHKTEMVVLQERRTIKEISVIAGNVEITSQRSLKYLGIRIGHNMNMTEHMKSVAAKADKTVAALSRMLPNVGGPKYSRRRVLSSVVNS